MKVIPKIAKILDMQDVSYIIPVSQDSLCQNLSTTSNWAFTSDLVKYSHMP